MHDGQRRILDSHEKVLAYLRDQGTPIAREAPAILDRLERTVADIDRYRQLFASAHLDVLAMDALISARGSTLARLNWKSARHLGKRIGCPPAPRKRAP